MSGLRIAKTALFVAIAASRNPVVREAIRNVPRAIPPAQRKAAQDVAKAGARKAGELAAKFLPPNRFF